jgi:ABC-2 type transport system permease protein
VSTETTATTDVVRTPSPAGPAPERPGVGSLWRATAAEWTKLWSVRSTWWCLGSALVLTAIWAGIVGFDYSYEDTGKPAPTEPYPVGDTATAAVQLGQFATLALAMLVITAEYANGSIRSTLQCVPGRLRVLLAKSFVVGAVMFAAGLVVAFTGVLAGWWMLGDLAEAEGSMLTTQVLSIAGYVALTGLFTLGLGFAVRSAVGTLSLAFVLLVLLRLILGDIGVDFIDNIVDFLPSNAGLSLLEGGNDDRYGRGMGAIVLSAWAAISLLIGYTVLRKRDA